MNDSRNLAQIAEPFGRERSTTNRLEDQMIRRALARRLSEKIKNYEKAAARLAMRGEDDAADALQRAAGRLRTITKNVPRETISAS